MKSKLISATVGISLMFTFMQPATAGAAHIGAVETHVTATAEPTSIYEQLGGELAYLASLPDSEADRIIARDLNAYDHQGPSLQVAPLVIVAAIGCAVSIGGGIFTQAWSDANSAAWALAGVLTSCIPGAQQAGLVRTILNNKDTIARALGAIGATGMAAALRGDTPQ